ncbi:MAG: DUF4905 domain-containing protein [Melioribacteraceae bacterium]
MLITPLGKLIIDSRDIDTKEAFFSCIDPETKKTIFKDFQLEEKYWIGIEAMIGDIIYLHKFTKPDMPGHKEIIAIDIMSQKILWTELKYSFLFAYENRIYCYFQKFEEREFVALDYLTGEIIDNFGSDYSKINERYEKSEKEKYSNEYKFPEIFTGIGLPETFSASITNEEEVEGDIEYLLYEDFIFLNFHKKNGNGFLQNKFIAYSRDKNKIIYEEVLNANAKANVPGSFFVHRNYLYLLKEKTELIVKKMT